MCKRYSSYEDGSIPVQTGFQESSGKLEYNKSSALQATLEIHVDFWISDEDLE